MTERDVDRLAIGLEVALGQAGRRKRGEAPILAGLVEIIGRRADPRGRHDEVAIGPGGRAVRRDADGKIEVEADSEAGLLPPRSCGDELAVGEPLQPGVKGDELPLLFGEGAHGVGGGMAELVRPTVPARAVSLLRHRLRQRLEKGVEIERLAALGDEALEILALGILRAGLEDTEKNPERLRLRRPPRADSRRARRREAPRGASIASSMPR